MKNENRLVIEKNYAIRPEPNGMTVYDKKKHKFFFFEGLTTEDVHREVPALDCAGFTAFMKAHEDRILVYASLPSVFFHQIMIPPIYEKAATVLCGCPVDNRSCLLKGRHFSTRWSVV